MLKIRYKTRKGQVIKIDDYEKPTDIDCRLDAYDLKEGERWVTIEGRHVVISEDGSIVDSFKNLFKKQGNTIVPNTEVHNWESAKRCAEGMGLRLSNKTKGISPKDIVETAKVVDKVKGTFPTLKDFVTDIDLYDGNDAILGMRSDGTFCISKWAYNSQGGVDSVRRFAEESSQGWKRDSRDVREGEDDKFSTRNRTFEGCVAHELGHALVNKLFWNSVQKQYNTNNLSDQDKADIKSMLYNHSMAREVLLEACHNTVKTPYGKGKTNNDLLRQVSGYACKNPPSETVAECVADWYDNRSKANPLSIEVVKVLNTWLGGRAIKGI